MARAPSGAPLTLANGEPFIGGDPFVMFDNGVYKMWHTAFVDGVLGTAYAQSQDGLVWEPLLDGHSRRLVLTPTPGSWDWRGIETVSVLKKDGRYFLWYLGYPGDIPDGQGRNDFIGLATSDDGVHFFTECLILGEMPWTFFSTSLGSNLG